MIYSIIESCRRLGVEPYSCLRDVLTMTNRQIKDIVPKAWAAAKKQTLRAKQPSLSVVNIVTEINNNY